MAANYLQSSHTTDFQTDSPLATLPDTCHTPASTGSVLGLVGPLSLRSDRVR